MRIAVTLLAFSLTVVPTQAQQAASEQQERPPSAGLHCLEMAQHVLYLVDQTAYNLCLGAGSDAPFQCFAAARQTTMLTDPQIVALCRCAMSVGPVQCYLEARRQAFLLDDQLTAMCSATVTQQVYGGTCLAPRY